MRVGLLREAWRFYQSDSAFETAVAFVLVLAIFLPLLGRAGSRFISRQ